MLSTLLLGSVALLPAPLPTLDDIAGELCAVPATRKDLPYNSLADLLPRRSFFGKTPRATAWSSDDRYLAFLWNPYEERGWSQSDFWDLYIYDTKTNETKRITTPDTFRQYDRDLPKALERYKKDEADFQSREKLSDIARREAEQKLKEDNEKNREPRPSYPGISEFSWAKKSGEMLLVYKGDIYRWMVGEKGLTRLTDTADPEGGVRYAKDDKSFFFGRASGVYRISFDSPMIRQLNPALPDGLTMAGFRMSPDETKVLVEGIKSGPEARQIDYVVFRDRFAQARKAPRSVADDPFTDESRLFFYDLDPDVTKGDGKPWEIFKAPGGKELQGYIVNAEPWSPDSRNVTFATWNRTKHDFDVRIADVNLRKVKTVYTTKVDGEHTSPTVADPFYAEDGKNILLTLENSGFRHIWRIDPTREGAEQVTKGDFEVYPIKGSKDPNVVFARSNKEDPSRMDLYKVTLPNGEMIRQTKKAGNYEGAAFSHDGNKIAAIFRSWREFRELCLIGLGEMTLTKSHNYERAKIYQTRIPELFTYKNRQGTAIHGYIFRPDGWKKTDKRPLMIYVYGGPLGEGHSVVDGDFNSTSYLWAMWMTTQMGYVTVCIDPRGQSGYGAAFGKANFGQPGVPQREDLEDGVKYLIETSGVDPKKVGINGWSFGGFQTLHCLLNASDVFTLGIAGAGPTQWQNYNNWYVGGVIGEPENGGIANIDKFSLTHVAKNLKAPLLLLHGMEDTNVLLQDTIMIYRKFLQMGKGPLVELVLDPTGSHGLGGDIGNFDRLNLFDTFVYRHWGPYVPEKAVTKKR